MQLAYLEGVALPLFLIRLGFQLIDKVYVDNQIKQKSHSCENTEIMLSRVAEVWFGPVL